MKLRLHANSIRLRLSRGEVAQLGATGQVDERITLHDGAVFGFSIVSTEVPQITAGMADSRIVVSVPCSIANDWVVSDQVGLEAPGILIEKDFQCLHQDAPVVDDSFPNPLAVP
jgi:hypothetical protein